jgi:hypothetical protein
LFLSSTVSQQLAVSNKKPRFRPKVSEVSEVQPWIKVGAAAWYQCEKEPSVPKGIQVGKQYSDYQLGRFKALAEYDYQVLGEGIETEGAPDFGKEIFYPPKAFLKPFWFKPVW